MRVEVQKNNSENFLSKAKSELSRLAQCSIKTPNSVKTPKPNFENAVLTKTEEKITSEVKYSNSFLAQTSTDDDPVESKMIRGNVFIEEGSPAFSQSLRNKKKLDKLKQV